MIPSAPIATDIVLLGGGHAHVHVLLAFAMKPAPGIRLTLVARDLETPYSGMLPGVVAGLYTRAQAHIDLAKLCAATGTRLIHGEATGLDRAAKRVTLRDRPPVAYDLVAIDVGIEPALDRIEGARAHGIAVKPIGSLLEKFDDLRQRCLEPDGPRRIAVIGGGAGGVELLLSVRSRLRAEASAPDDLSFALVTADEILASHNARVRDAFRRGFRERGIGLHENRAVRAIRPGAIEVDGGEPVAADAVLVTTQAAAPGWLRDIGLPLDAGGFLRVGPTLQSTGDPDVFAAGDCAALADPRPKAGVFAVRAGPPLAENLRRRARGEATRPWTPQKSHLALISTGERYAVASRGGFKAEGAWLWTLKDWIDRRWMRMYQDTDRLLAKMQTLPASAASSPARSPEAMRCGGCAAKVGPGPLSRALARLPSPAVDGAVVVGLGAPDDAAILEPHPGRQLVQTVDFFRAFIDDPYVFGQVAANHALNDVFAMGAAPRHALAIAMVPHGPSAKVEEALFQMLAGARECFDAEGVALVGGHSSEGAELALGFSVTGDVAPGQALRKSGLRPGDALVLTRPIGTGILFAAAMRARAPAPAIEAALAEMRRSNRAAAEILAAHGATAMTDVTGYGLAGHLGEMLAASEVSATLALDRIPAWPEAVALARAGIASTLLPENLALRTLIAGAPAPADLALLFDPQTAGGLLAGVAADREGDCVLALLEAGYTMAATIGVVRPREAGGGESFIHVGGTLVP